MPAAQSRRLVADRHAVAPSRRRHWCLVAYLHRKHNDQTRQLALNFPMSWHNATFFWGVQIRNRWRFCTMHLPREFHNPIFARSDFVVLTNKQTDSVTFNALHEATSVGNVWRHRMLQQMCGYRIANYYAHVICTTTLFITSQHAHCTNYKNKQAPNVSPLALEVFAITNYEDA